MGERPPSQQPVKEAIIQRGLRKVSGSRWRGSCYWHAFVATKEVRQKRNRNGQGHRGRSQIATLRAQGWSWEHDLPGDGSWQADGAAGVLLKYGLSHWEKNQT